MGILEKIKEIEAEMQRTQKNKATEFHFGMKRQILNISQQEKHIKLKMSEPDQEWLKLSLMLAKQLE